MHPHNPQDPPVVPGSQPRQAPVSMVQSPEHAAQMRQNLQPGAPTGGQAPQAEAIPNVIYDPDQAVLWLLAREHNGTARRLVDRLACWIVTPAGRVPDVDGIAQAVIEHDEYMVKWRDYCNRHPSPNSEDDRVYQDWEDRGPACPDSARVIGPMSGGEKRMVRMLAVLSNNERVEFSISDIDGLDAPFRRDWRRLVAGEDWGK